MGEVPFYATRMGRQFYESTMPKLVEQLERLNDRRRIVGDKRIQGARAEWRELFEKFGSAMEAGIDPAGAAVQALARKAKRLIDEFTGGEPSIQRSPDKMNRDGPGARDAKGGGGAGYRYREGERAGEHGRARDRSHPGTGFPRSVRGSRYGDSAAISQNSEGHGRRRLDCVENVHG